MYRTTDVPGTKTDDVTGTKGDDVPGTGTERGRPWGHFPESKLESDVFTLSIKSCISLTHHTRKDLCPGSSVGASPWHCTGWLTSRERWQLSFPP